MRIIILPIAALALQGCVVAKVAETAVDVVSVPVKATGYAVDKMTTSQAEADRNYGKKYRKAEEKYGRDLKRWNKACKSAREAGEACPPQPEFQPPD